MDNGEKIILEWKYNPIDFFEGPFLIENDDYKIEINNGNIKATVSPKFYDSKKDARLNIHEEVNALFLGSQTLNFKPFHLSKPSMSRLRPDGRKDVTIYPDPIECKVTANFDLTITDKYGNIIEDTRAERIAKKRRFAQLAATYKKADSIVGSILNSYNNAVNDHSNEFIHLYEIMESLCGKFGNEKGLRDALGISRNKIERLRKLANKEPLTQGRHRGKSPGQLRDATNAEKNQARDIAQQLIHRYLEYIDTNS